MSKQELISAGICTVLLFVGPAAADGPAQSLDHAALEAAGWPCWRGPTGSGSAADYPGKVIEDITEAKWIWEGEDRHPVEYNGTCSPLTGSGCVSPVFWNNRVYLVYQCGSLLRRLDAKTIGHTYVRPGQKPIVIDEARRKKMVNGYRGGSGQHQAKMVGGGPVFTEELAERYTLNLYNDDAVVCHDADTGKVLWRTRWLSHFSGSTGSYHNSPCIDDGRLYVLLPGMTRVLCLDAMTGELIWAHDDEHMSLSQAIIMRERMITRYKSSTGRGNAGVQHSIVVDGCLVCAAGTFDAKTGERLRDGSSVPTRWVHQGKEYLLSGNSCIEPRTGKVLWSIEGVGFGMARNSGGNPPVTENYCAAWTKSGWTGYRLSLDGAEKIWNIPDLKHGTGAAVIHKGYAVTGGSDKKGRCLVAVKVDTGKIAFKLNYDQKGSKNFPDNPLNNLWCGITSAVAMDGHVFWRRYRSGGGGLTMMTVPGEGREFGVAIKEGPLLGYSHTPAAGDGRLFVRMKGYLRCLDFRRDAPPPRPVPPDQACKDLSGILANLGSAYRSERDAAVAELATAANAGMAPTLVTLISDAEYPTARAAAKAIEGAAAVKAEAAAALKTLVETSGNTLPATRLGLCLHALQVTSPSDAAAVTKALLKKGAGDSKVMGRTCEALAEPVFADDITLHKAVLPELKTALAEADGTMLGTVGAGMRYLDLEPRTVTTLVGDLITAMKRAQAAPFHVQRLVLVGLEKCEDNAVFRQAAEFAVATWPERGTKNTGIGSGTFSMAIFNACPPKVAEIAIPKLVVWPHHAEAALLKKIGAAAIPALEAHRKKSSGKVTGMIDKLLKELRKKDEVEDAMGL